MTHLVTYPPLKGVGFTVRGAPDVRSSSLISPSRFRPGEKRPGPTLSSWWFLKRNRACLNVGGFTEATFRASNRGTATGQQGRCLEQQLPPDPRLTRKSLCVQVVVDSRHGDTGFLPPLKGVGFRPKFL
jgi:hypothetical protein